MCFVKLTPIQAAADDICWTPCSWNEALHKKSRLYVSSLCWKPPLESLLYLEKLTSMSSTTGRLLSVDFSVSGNPISSFMRKSLSADESSWSLWSLLFNCSLSGVLCVRPGTGRWPRTDEFRWELFVYFLVCLFWTNFATRLSCNKSNKKEIQNTFFLNGQIIIITLCHKLSLPGLLFSKSGYTYVGSAEYSIDIYRK